MGWAAGFRTGSEVARQALDTYNSARQKREIEDVMAQQRGVTQGYTAEDGQQLDAIANAKDAEGNPYYNVTANQDGSYTVGSNFQLDGQTPQAVGMAPRTVTDYAGRRYAGELDDAQLRGLQRRAVADVMTKYDPAKGMSLGLQLDTADREAERFGWDRQAQPLKQQAAELQLKGLKRVDTQAENAIKLQDEERQFSTQFMELYKNKDSSPEAMQQWVQAVSPYVQAMHKYNGDQNNYFVDEKTGMVRGVPRDGDKAFAVDPMAALPMVMQMRRMSSQFGGDPLAAAEAINKMTDAERERFLKADDRNYSRAVANAGLLDKRLGRDETSRHNRAVEGNAAAGLQLRREALNVDKQRVDSADWQLIGPSEDGKGLVQFNKRSGGMRLTPLPPGANAKDVWRRISGAGSESSKPTKVADEGEKYLVGGQLKVSDGRGGYIAEDGVLPSMRTTVLKKAGVPDNMINQLTWHPNGLEVVTPGGDAYSLDDLPTLVADMKRLTKNTAKVEELQKPPRLGLTREEAAAQSPYRLDNMFSNFDPTLGAPKITFPYQGR